MLEHIIVVLLIHYITPALWEVCYELNNFRNMGKTAEDERTYIGETHCRKKERRNSLVLSANFKKVIN